MGFNGLGAYGGGGGGGGGESTRVFSSDANSVDRGLQAVARAADTDAAAAVGPLTQVCIDNVFALYVGIQPPGSSFSSRLLLSLVPPIINSSVPARSNRTLTSLLRVCCGSRITTNCRTMLKPPPASVMTMFSH